MANVRLPRTVCAAIDRILVGPHAKLDRLFLTAGAPGPPPDLAHATKWTEWLFSIGNDPNVDTLSFLGNILEEFMDVPPDEPSAEFPIWNENRDRVVQALEEIGLRYYRFGRVLPTGQTP